MKWRALLLLPLSLCLSAASPLPKSQVIEAGQVLATLNDWRAILFVMMFIVIALLGMLAWAFSKMGKAVEAMVSVREAISGLAQLAENGTRDASDNRNALRNIEMTLSRMESRGHQ